MKLASLLRPAAVVAELHSTEKIGVLRELSGALAKAIDGLDENKIFKALAERERLGSTGVGDGVAIPHAKINGIKQLYAAFGRSIDGIDFDSPDNKPSHLFFMLIAPDDSVVSHLEALKRVSFLLDQEENRNKLMQAKSPQLYQALQEVDEKG